MDVSVVLSLAEQQCREKGARLTPKRKQVLSGLLSSSTALSAYELVDYCKTEHGQSIPPMSVYRILDFLQQQRLVHKLSLANKYVACSHIHCDHDHGVSQFLICSECQRVEEITLPNSTIDDLEQSVNKAGFLLASPQLEMNCVCESCSESVASQA